MSLLFSRRRRGDANVRRRCETDRRRAGDGYSSSRLTVASVCAVGSLARRAASCAEHVWSLGGASPPPNLMEVKGKRLARAALIGWMGPSARLIEPLLDVMTAEVLASASLHTDDTPVPVLDKERSSTRQGRLWAYLGDDLHPYGRLPQKLIFTQQRGLARR